MGGKLQVLQWLRAEGCPWNYVTCHHAAESGNLELVQWLRGEGCPWDDMGWTCSNAVEKGHVEVLRWARENGCPWTAATRDEAAEKLGYTDDLGNGEYESLDEEDGYGYSDE